MNKALIDTNICLDAILDRVPFTDNALKIIEQSQEEKFNGLLSAHALDAIFYITEKLTNQTKAYKGIKELRKAFDIAPVNQQIIDKAIADKWKDFEDAIHYQAALAADCDAVVTRNEKDFSGATIPVYDPVDFLEELR